MNASNRCLSATRQVKAGRARSFATTKEVYRVDLKHLNHFRVRIKSQRYPIDEANFSLSKWNVNNTEERQNIISWY